MNNIITFNQTKDSPQSNNPGIVLAIPKNIVSIKKKDPMLIHGCCRAAKHDLNKDRKNLLRGIYITVIDIFDQMPKTVNLLGQRLIFDDDIIDTGSDYITYFHGDLIEILSIAYTPFVYYVHASFCQYVSNVIRVEIKEKNE